MLPPSGFYAACLFRLLIATSYFKKDGEVSSFSAHIIAKESLAESESLEFRIESLLHPLRSICVQTLVEQAGEPISLEDL